MNGALEKNSAAVRKRIANHEFTDEGGEEYEGSEFGGFGDYFRRKKIKLQNLDVELRAAAGDKPQIFKGVVAHVTGYTQPPLHVLHQDLVQHGAGFLQYLDGKTMATHIIASAMPPKKSVDFTRYRVVKPAWVTDSIQAGKLLPWTDYRVIEESARQKTINFSGGKMMSQQKQQSPSIGYREQTQNSFYTSQLQKTSPHAKTPQQVISPFQPRSATKFTRVTYDSFQDDAMDVDVPLKKSDSVPDTAHTAMTPSHKLSSPSVQNEVKETVQNQSAPDQSMPPPDRSLQTPGRGKPAADQSILPPDQDLLPPGRNILLPDRSMPAPQRTMPPPDRSMPPPKLPIKRPLTSEEHNAILLSDPHIRKASTANPDFLRQYYSESRLHHLSTWKAELKSRLQKSAAEKGLAAKGTKRPSGSRRYIMHVDFDSFFCAVSLKRAPEFVDKPVVVAHGNGTGSEIASCNYPAREFGVKNGMWMKRALELCPDLKILPYDFPAYEEASRLFYDAILEVGGIVQSVSIDEALVDITDIVLSATGSKGVGISEGSIYREQEKADEIASNLRAEVKNKTGCNVSIGMGANVLLAKIALRKAKPAGQYQVRPEEVLDIIADLSVEDLPGVAHSIGGKLEEMGIKLVRDIRQTPKERLVTALGPKTGEKLYEYARGIDRAEVGDQPARKTVSTDVNWGIRFVSQTEAEAFVRNMCKELERRLVSEGVKGRHFTMKIMRRALDAPLDPPKHLGHGKCDTFNKSTTFGVATHDAQAIGKEAVAILRSFNFSPGDLRGLGLHMSKLQPIKPSANLEGSQRKLSFANLRSAARKPRPPEQIDSDSGPPLEETKSLSGQSIEQDPIAVDPLTPKKPKAVHPAMVLAQAGAADGKAGTPINIKGTQFLIPSNPDPAVLAELPRDIRSKLVAQGSNNSSKRTSAASSRETSPAAKYRSTSPALADGIPNDIDPEVLNALPEEMQTEVLAEYDRSRRRGRVGGSSSSGSQSSLSQSSPRKNRIRDPSPSPSKGGGIMSMFSKALDKEKERERQFEASQISTADEETAHDTAVIEPIGELDPEFLAELPEDVRKEILEDHSRQQKRRAQEQSAASRRPVSRQNSDEDVGSNVTQQTTLQFPKLPPKISFMHNGESGVEKIKSEVKAWHDTFRAEGPHRADVEVYENYLKRVITQERDMNKARVLVKWLEWLVEGAKEQNRGKEEWRTAVSSVKKAVQDAMKQRGLGKMCFTPR
ncbi:hypothetical protein QBC35DRAFT_463013 [Podospora australis]|uniref:DNA repair protein REV1 n=1 Tax=Podospora australis TaxID=1536484 RepID=A0AAN6WU28_9PEZI|nr:hypothetical protein QBC35DRAFT_463013 [Podospora australis]